MKQFAVEQLPQQTTQSSAVNTALRLTDDILSIILSCRLSLWIFLPQRISRSAIFSLIAASLCDVSVGNVSQSTRRTGPPFTTVLSKQSDLQLKTA